MSGTEIIILLGVAIVVVGPKRLPAMMRSAGRWIAKIRRMTMDVRENTGIDKIIREEGLEKEIRELSTLTRSPMFRSMMNLSPTSLVANALAQSAASPATTSPLAPVAPKPSLLDPTKSLGATIPAPATPSTTAGASSAADLIKPAEGNVSRGDVSRGDVSRGSDQAFAALQAAGFFSFREREYPTIGCDAYDALPDDLDDPDAYPDELPETAEAAPTEDAAQSAPSAPTQSTASDKAEPSGEAKPETEAVQGESANAEPAKAEPVNAEPANAEPTPANSEPAVSTTSSTEKAESAPATADQDSSADSARNEATP